MSKGQIFHSTFSEYTDPYTGTVVKRLTDPSILSHHMYFYNRMTTSDGQYLLICQKRDEGRQLYTLNLHNGEIRQITEGDGVGQDSAMFSHDDKTIFYQQNNRFYAMDAQTLETHCFYETPEGWSGSAPGMSSDNRFMSIVETKQDTLPPRDGSAGWNFFALTCEAKPLCRIVYIDVETGKSHVVLEDHCWFGHTQIRPNDPYTILFCHEGPYDLIDARLWLIQSDGSRYRCCRKQPSDLILTHEFWLPDGSKFAYVYRETTGDKIENIRLMDPETLKEEILMPCSPFAHFICDKKNEYMVGDSQGSDVPIHLLTEEMLKEKANTISNDFIYLIDVKKRTEKKLCYHGTSWLAKHGNPQDSHPHPCFSEDNKSIIFVSDREGLPCIYQVMLNN